LWAWRRAGTGRVRFRFQGRRLEAYLDKYGIWHCPGEAYIQKVLRTLCAEEAIPSSVADGRPGMRWLHAAREMLQGEVFVNPFDPNRDDPPETKY
jgi:hypothetical protein